MKTIRLKLLTLMLVIGMILPIASQAYDFYFDRIYYNILSEEDRTVEVTYVKWGSDNKNYVKGHVSIPQKVIYNSKSYSVTTIGSHAFFGCSGLTSVDIPSSVTTIESYAFFGCSGLTSVDIPSSVIESYAFLTCSGLTSVKLSSSVTTIESNAFSCCYGLTSVDIPSSVTTIGDCAFLECSKLSIINVQQDNPNYISMDGVLYSKKEGVVTSVVECPERKKGIIKIPSSVTTIASYAFYKCSGLTSVDILGSVTTIGSNAFFGCSGLTSVDIPSSVTTIESEAFSCSGLTSVDIPSSVTTIGDGAFGHYNSKLEKIYCHWEKPIKADGAIFPDECLRNSTLYVPIGTKSEYEKVDPWRNFWNIEEGDYEATSGIKDVVGSEESTLEETDRFDISGKHVSKDYKGLVIIRYSDGSIKKQIVK